MATQKQPKQFDAVFQIKMKHPSWEPGAKLRVRVDNVISPWKFSVQLDEKIPTAIVLEDKLTDYVKMEWAENERRVDPVTGAWNYDEQYFSVRNFANNKFARCHLLTEPEIGADRRLARRGKVFLLDHGVFQMLTTLHELRQLDFNFCRLPAISALAKCPNEPKTDAQKWSLEAIDRFRTLVEGKTCTVEVLNVQQENIHSPTHVVVQFEPASLKNNMDMIRALSCVSSRHADQKDFHSSSESESDSDVDTITEDLSDCWGDDESMLSSEMPMYNKGRKVSLSRQ